MHSFTNSRFPQKHQNWSLKYMKKNCRSLRERKEKKRERERKRLLWKCLWICFFWFSTLGHRAYSFWDKRKTCTIKTTNPTFSQAWSSMDVLIKYLLSSTVFFFFLLYIFLSSFFTAFLLSSLSGFFFLSFFLSLFDLPFPLLWEQTQCFICVWQELYN